MNTGVAVPVGTLGLLLAEGSEHSWNAGTAAQAVRHTQDELESPVSSQSCSTPGVGGTGWDEFHPWNAGMEGAGRGEVW